MLGASTAYVVVVIPMLMISGGMALTIAPFTGSIMSAVPPSRAGVGSAMNDTTRELGGALGVAVLGSLVLSQYQSAIDPALAGLPEAARSMADSGLAGALQVAAGLEPSAGAELVAQARDAFLTGMGFACTVGAVVVAVAGVMTWRLLPSASGEATRVRPASTPSPAAGTADTADRACTRPSRADRPGRNYAPASLTWTSTYRIRQIVRNSLAIVPILYLVAAVVAGSIIPAIDRELHTPELLGRNPDSVRDVLSSIATGMLTFTGFVVTVVLLLVQFGTATFGPRLIRWARQARLLKHALGMFAATFMYALVTLDDVQRDDETFVPNLTVSFAIVLLVASVVLFFLLLDGITNAMRPAAVGQSIAKRARTVLDQRLSRSRRWRRPTAVVASRSTGGGGDHAEEPRRHGDHHRPRGRRALRARPRHGRRARAGDRRARP